MKKSLIVKDTLLYIMGAFYVFAGINHFINPEPYLKIMPAYIPYHNEMVQISGVIEIILGILVMIKKTRKWSAWGIILLLIAVFPANIQMAIDYYQQRNPYLWLAILRLPLQLLLIWWAYIYTKNKNDY